MKTQQCSFRTGPTQTELYKRRRWLEAEIFYLKSRGIVTLLSMEEIIHVAKTKVLIRFAVTAKLSCAFVFADAKCWFFHDMAHFISRVTGLCVEVISSTFAV